MTLLRNIEEIMVLVLEILHKDKKQDDLIISFRQVEDTVYETRSQIKREIEDKEEQLRKKLEELSEEFLKEKDIKLKIRSIEVKYDHKVAHFLRIDINVQVCNFSHEEEFYLFAQDYVNNFLTPLIKSLVKDVATILTIEFNNVEPLVMDWAYLYGNTEDKIILKFFRYFNAENKDKDLLKELRR